MRQAFKKNQQGSVLLAVVCMSMILLTLATISMGVVNVTTKTTAENVERTQAKVTAEAALTQFVEEYKNQSPNNTFDGLDALASGSDFDSGHKINLSMVDEHGNPIGLSDYGNVQLSAYIPATGGMKLESRCTYGSQTQSASVYFKATLNTPYIPSNTLAARNGAVFQDGKATPIDGNTYIEKPTTPSADWPYDYITTSNDAEYQGHTFSEYNILLNSNTKFIDGLNTTGTDKFNRGSDPLGYFRQAPTLIVDGYFSAKNSCSIKTTVGKSDINGNNSDDTPYDTAHLANTDGFIYVFKKFIMGAQMGIGDSTHPIDVYCRGAYIGYIPGSINGIATEKAEILAAYNGGGDLVQQDNAIEVNGNFYSYKTGSNDYQNGAVIINCTNPNQGLFVHGDMYVKGDIILVGNAGLGVDGTLHCTGKIYKAMRVGSDGITTTNAGAGTWEIQEVSTGVYSLNKVGGSASSINVSAGAFSNYIDLNEVRNQIPDVGYDPATGNTSAERKGLSVYDNCSPNDMFLTSLNDNHNSDTAHKEAAKRIAKKYANAMTTGLGDDYTSETGVTDSVSETTADYIKIKGSVRLERSDVDGWNPNQVKKYYVDLRDEDIVIALPANTGSWDYISSMFRIKRNTTPGHDATFVYFMYYDESHTVKPSEYRTKLAEYQADPTHKPKPEQETFYLFTSDGAYSEQTYANIPYYMTPSTANSNRTISWDCANGILHIADIDGLADTYTTDVKSTFNANTIDKKDQIKNFILQLVPDGVDFTVGGNGQCLQSLVYAPKSTVQVKGSNSYIVGKVNCSFFKSPQDNKSGIVRECTEASGSILGYVELQNATQQEIKIQYYEY